MNKHSEIIMDSLEIIGELNLDLVPLVYQRFYTTYPETRQMFGRDEHGVHQGHMFNGMLMAVIERASNRCASGCIDAWVADHNLWGVKKAMFRAMFDSLYQTIRECLGTHWNEAFEEAWYANIYGLADDFERVCDAERLCA